ncbi:hypothetical protein [Halobellus rufus]|uniref:hypothetical protein n=1 Tax=Halobellus rufus TaxID=1448860 RepID=UPI0006784F98|nr:hypothetical protein [Halobellus rufus]
MFEQRLERLRGRIRQGALSVGAGGVVIGASHDLAIGGVLLAVAFGAIALDERLTRSERLPWGGR